MIRRSILAMAVAATLNSTAAHAVVVGDIQLHSALNEALNADISLHRIDDAELEGLRVVLASPEAFARVGIERPYYLTGLKFMPTRNAVGDPVVHISSTAAIQDPFLNFLVEVNWSKGKVMREFTLLLDPPTSYRGAAAQILAPQTDVMPGISHQPQSEDTGATNYRVPVNDTLWAIAKRHKSAGVSAKQMLDAIFRNNPGAFINNDMNRLKAGQVLRIPSVQAMEGASYTRARHEYLARTSAWDATEPATVSTAPVIPLDARTDIPMPEDRGDRVELLTSGAEASAEAGKGSFEERTLGQLEKDLLLAREQSEKMSSENTELQGRLKYLESQLADMKRLLTLKHDTAAQLQEEALIRQKTEELQTRIEEVKTEAEEAVKAEAREQEAAAAEPETKPTEEPQVAEATAEAEEPAGTSADTALPTAPRFSLDEVPPSETQAAEVPAEEAQTDATQPEETSPEAAPEEAQAASPSDEVLPTAPEARSGVDQPEEIPAAEPAEAQIEETTATEAAAEPQEAAPEAAKPQDTPTAEAGAPEAEQDWMAMLLENPLIPAAGGGLVLLLLLLALMKRRQAARKDGAKVVDTEPMVTGVAQTMATDSVQVASDIQGGDGTDSSLIVDFTPSELAGMHDDTESDPVTEADVFMAYGRYQDARQKLLEGLEQSPERNDIKLKLLEVLYASGNKEVFKKTASAYKAQGLAKEEPEGWRRVALLGQGMDIDDPVFSFDEEADAEPADEPLVQMAPEVEDQPEVRPEVKDTYASVLSDVAQGLAELDAEPEEVIDEPLDLEGLKLGDSLLVPSQDSEPLVGFGAIDSGDLDLSGLDLSRLEADSQVWPLDEAEEDKPRDFEHEDILGQDRVDDDQELAIDFSSAEDQALLSSIEAVSELGSVEIDSELNAVLDKAAGRGDAGRVDLESELSTLTQELENFSSDSELRLHPMDDDSLLTEIEAADAEDDLSSTRLLEEVADGKVNLDDYALGLDSINLEQELADLEKVGLDKTLPRDSGLTTGMELDAASSGFDFEKELADLGDLGLDDEQSAQEDGAGLTLSDLDLGDSNIDLEHELAGLDFLGGGTQVADEDQVQTKLELAQAYMEMGDAEGAKEILAEVEQDGSPEQQAKARAMLDSIG